MARAVDYFSESGHARLLFTPHALFVCAAESNYTVYCRWVWATRAPVYSKH
jgi:hypothetical protein